MFFKKRKEAAAAAIAAEAKRQQEFLLTQIYKYDKALDMKTPQQQLMALADIYQEAEKERHQLREEHDVLAKKRSHKGLWVGISTGATGLSAIVAGMLLTTPILLTGGMLIPISMVATFIGNNTPSLSKKFWAQRKGYDDALEALATETKNAAIWVMEQNLQTLAQSPKRDKLFSAIPGLQQRFMTATSRAFIAGDTPTPTVRLDKPKRNR